MNHKDFLDIPGAQEEELSSKQLRIGYWIASHRAGLRQTGIAFLIAFDILLGGYNIYSWTAYFLSGYFNDQKNAAELARTIDSLSALVASHAAAPLAIEGAVAYESAVGRFDAVALMNNPNKEWYASFDYLFDVGSGRAAIARGFLLPEEERPVGVFNIEGVFETSEPSLHLSNIRWRHISKHDIADVSAYLAARKKFVAMNVQMSPGNALGLPEGRLNFDLLNQSFYDYRDPEFFVGVWNGATLSRVYKIHVPQFFAGEARAVEIAIPSSILVGATVKLYPHIDFFDSSVYLK